MPARRVSARSVVHVLGSVAVGVLVGLVGTGIHRFSPPLGLLLAYLTVLSAAVLVRAWARGAGLLGLAVGLGGTVLAMAYVRPGDDVIVVGDGLGYGWLAGVAVVGLALVLPRRWFSDRPIGAGPDGRAPGRP